MKYEPMDLLSVIVHRAQLRAPIYRVHIADNPFSNEETRYYCGLHLYLQHGRLWTTPVAKDEKLVEAIDDTLADLCKNGWLCGVVSVSAYQCRHCKAAKKFPEGRRPPRDDEWRKTKGQHR